MIDQRPACVRNRAVWGLVLLSALYSGCQTVEIGHGHDSYYEQGGMWCVNARLGVVRARVAVVAALTHLRMPIYREGALRRGLFIDTRTPENCEARVFIVALGRHGEGTRISVRVGGFGTHREMCARLLDEITQYLEGRPVDAVPVVPAPSPSVAMPVAAPTPAGTPTTGASDPALPLQPVPVEK
jgi:hypothetical protein